MGSWQPPLRAEPGEVGGVTSFMARIQHSTAPAGMCDYSWRGLRCERLICLFAHDQGTGTVTHALPPPPPPHSRRRNSIRRNQPRQQGQRGQDGVEHEGCGRTPCALAGTTCELAGAAGEGEMAAITDSTGSAVKQGRPRGGQGREKRGLDYFRRRPEVRRTSQCTRTRVDVASLASW